MVFFHLLISLKGESEGEESRRRDGKRKNIGRKVKKNQEKVKIVAVQSS